MTNKELLQIADQQKNTVDITPLRSEFIYSSEALSGLSASLEEVHTLLTTGQIPESMTDEQACAIMGHGIAFDAMRQLAASKVPVTVELLGEFHRMLLGADSASPYRTTPLRHGADPDDLSHLMSHFIDQMTSSAYLHPIEYAAMCHKRLLNIRPWSTDNHKTARLLMNYVLISHGFPPACIGPEQSEQYYTALNALRTQYDIDSFTALLAENVIQSQKKLETPS